MGLDLPTPPAAPVLATNPPFRKGDKPIAPSEVERTRYTRLDQEARARSAARLAATATPDPPVTRKESLGRTALSGYRTLQGRR